MCIGGTAYISPVKPGGWREDEAVEEEEVFENKM